MKFTTHTALALWSSAVLAITLGACSDNISDCEERLNCDPGDGDSSGGTSSSGDGDNPGSGGEASTGDGDTSTGGTGNAPSSGGSTATDPCEQADCSAEFFLRRNPADCIPTGISSCRLGTYQHPCIVEAPGECLVASDRADE